MADAWTDTEIDLIVADYFAMLGAELAGRATNKAEHNRELQTLIARGRGAIEFKHQNISAVANSSRVHVVGTFAFPNPRYGRVKRRMNAL